MLHAPWIIYTMDHGRKSNERIMSLIEYLVLSYLVFGGLLATLSLVAHWKEVVERGPLVSAGAWVWMTVGWLFIYIHRDTE
jgi:hypothetical protein